MTEVVEMAAPNEPSLRNGNILLGSQFISDFGDQITAAILALSILDITQSTSRVGLVYFVSTVGFLLFTFFGGYLGDIISKKKILIYSDLGRGIVVLLMIVALHMKSIALIYVTSFLLSMLSALHRPVKFGLWAESLPRHHHERYNCFSELSTHASIILGPLIASFLLTHERVDMGVCVNAATFVACALMISLLFKGHNTVVAGHKNYRDHFVGFKLIRGDRELGKYVVYDAMQMLAYGAFNATFLVLAQRDFGWSKAQYSVHLTIAAGFAVLGAALGAWRYIANLNATRKLIGCTIISALSLAMVLYTKTFPLSSLLFGICEAAAIIAMVVTKTKVQIQAHRVHDQFISSILAARLILIKAATLFGAGACLLIDRFIQLEATLWIFLAPVALGFLPFIPISKKPNNQFNGAMINLKDLLQIEPKK